MKKILIVALVLSSLLAVNARAAVVTINFEDLSGSGEMDLNRYGLTFENIGTGGQGWAYYDGAQTGFDPSSGVERIYNFASANGSRDNNNRILFNQNVTFLGLWMAGYSAGQQIIGYVGGVPTYSTAALPNLLLPFGQFFNVNWVGVDAISVSSANGDSYILDDLKFDTSVTTPDSSATIALLGGVALMLEGARRRLVPAPARVRVR